MLDIIVETSVSDRWEGQDVLGVCRFAGCKAIDRQRAVELEASMAAAALDLQRKGRAVLDEERVQQMRTTFRAMPDMDPARYRPASESLIRRVLEAGFFRISPMVDANNLLSVNLRIPLGIYDLGSVPLRGWIYRLGYQGETYKTLSHQEKGAGGKLVLADGSAVLGSPVTDSGRAPIRPDSSDVAVVAYLPQAIAPEATESILDRIASTFTAWFSPETVERHIAQRA